jgi:hypothetical protein
MRIALFAVAVLAACGKDSVPLPGVDAPGGGPVTEVSGHVHADTTWADAIDVTASTIIDPGVTVTVTPGTTISVAAAATITVQGTLDIQGTSAAKVDLAPAAGAPHWLGFTVQSGGVLTAHYFVETGGSVDTGGTAKVTLIDSQLSKASHDLLVMAGGSVDVEYSSIGLEIGQGDTTHCDMHTGAPNAIKVVHTNLSTASYGIMFYGGSNADFTYDNWFGNGVDVDLSPGSGASGNFSFGWFEKATGPTGIGITATNLSSTRLADAGPRP